MANFKVALLGLAMACALVPTLAGCDPRLAERIAIERLNPRQPSIPCEPEGPPDGLVRISPDRVVSNDPNIDVVEDQIVTTEIDLASEHPYLLMGNDDTLAESGCAASSSFDMDDPLPPMAPPPSSVPPLPPASSVAVDGANLPPITFVPPAHCLGRERISAACGQPLDCSLPFCGRDIIFVHGLIDEALKDLVKAKHGLGGPASFGSLVPWPQGGGSFTLPGQYFREHAYGRWRNYVQNKLGPAYRSVQPTRSPRLLIVAWPTTQRMEVGVHAVLTQIARAMQHGTGVMRLDMTRPDTPIVPAHLYEAGFCGRGCIIVSHSTGGPVSIASMRMAALGGRPWLTPSLQSLPRYIKGHVASHPALSGAEIAFHALAAGNSVTGGCAFGLELLDALGPSPPLPPSLTSCGAVQALNDTVLVDLAPPVMDLLWRPLFEAAVPAALAVPTVVVASAHPTAKPVLHWSAPVLPGYDDGVLSVDSQLGRKWYPLGAPRSLSLNAWGLIGARYFDRGAPTARSIPYFLDQNLEHNHRPSSHAAAPNPYLSPNGMRLPDLSFNEVPPASSGLPNVFSFLQSTSDHFFPRYVGESNPSSQPNDAADGCRPGSYSYRPTGNLFGPQAAVNEESRAVFDQDVYTNLGRNIFAAAEAQTGSIPLLSTQLKSAIEGEARGRYIRLRFKLLRIDRVFWIWKREYFRMRDWRCRDEIDYTLEFAFRR